MTLVSDTFTPVDSSQQCINTIRTLTIDAVQQANSGHPGAAMALAPFVYTLWNRVLQYDPLGIREHGMGATVNGLALSKLRPYGATYLIFTDYARPAIRALMELPSIFVATHDAMGAAKPDRPDSPSSTSRRGAPFPAW